MWLYKNKVIEKLDDFGENIYGFVYKIIENKTGKFYIGKKQILSKTKVKKGKKEMAKEPIQRGRKSLKKLVIKEMDWQNYNGSNKPLLEEIKKQGIENFTKEILMICPNKKLLTYYELYYQIKADVLTVENTFNDNISGHYFRKDFIDLNLEAQ